MGKILVGRGTIKWDNFGRGCFQGEVYHARYDIVLFGHIYHDTQLVSGLSNIIPASSMSTQMADLVCGLDCSDISSRGPN